MQNLLDDSSTYEKIDLDPLQKSQNIIFKKLDEWRKLNLFGAKKKEKILLQLTLIWLECMACRRFIKIIALKDPWYINSPFPILTLLLTSWQNFLTIFYSLSQNLFRISKILLNFLTKLKLLKFLITTL